MFLAAEKPLDVEDPRVMSRDELGDLCPSGGIPLSDDTQLPAYPWAVENHPPSVWVRSFLLRLSNRWL